MGIDQETLIKVLNIEGVAACSDKTKEIGGCLHVYLLVDTIAIHGAVLQTIGSRLPMSQVIFESSTPIKQCSFCGKLRKEVRKLVEPALPTSFIHGREVNVKVRICDECIARAAAL